MHFDTYFQIGNLVQKLEGYVTCVHLEDVFKILEGENTGLTLNLILRFNLRLGATPYRVRFLSHPMKRLFLDD